MEIGTGFHTFDVIRVADINGDGYSDLVGRKPNGTLWYYGNNILVSPPSPHGTSISQSATDSTSSTASVSGTSAVTGTRT
jgi:hypothetical protein